MLQNKITATVLPATSTQVMQKVVDITVLLPFLIGLSIEERSTLAKMGDNTVEFVNDSLMFAQTNTGYVPSFLNVTELQTDINLVNALKPFRGALAQLLEKVDDTIMAAGSDAYTASLVFYNSVKLAAKMGMPGADAIYQALKIRFEGMGGTGDGGTEGGGGTPT